MSIHQRHHSFSTDAITNLIIQTREVNRLRDLVRRPQPSARRARQKPR